MYTSVVDQERLMTGVEEQKGRNVWYSVVYGGGGMEGMCGLREMCV